MLNLFLNFANSKVLRIFIIFLELDEVTIFGLARAQRLRSVYRRPEATITRKVFLSKLHVYVWIDLNGRDRLWRMQLHLEQQRGTFFWRGKSERHVFTAVCFQKSDRQITWIFLRRRKQAFFFRDLVDTTWQDLTNDSLCIFIHSHSRVTYIQMCNCAYNCTEFYFHVKRTPT